MATYALTVSTNALGLGVLSGARVVVERRRTQISDIFSGQALIKNTSATNTSGIAVMFLSPDDSSVYHELKIFDLAGIPVYSVVFTMPPQAVALTDLPVGDIISKSAQQAVQAKEDAENFKSQAQTSAEAAANSEAAAEEQAIIATNKAIQASIILESTMRKITVNTDNDIPNYNTLLSDYIIKVKSSARNGGFSTTYYFDFDNQSLNWIPTVGL